MAGLTEIEQRNALIEYLSEVLNVSVENLKDRTVEHPPAKTVADWIPHIEQAEKFKGKSIKLCKNLFLRDRSKGTLWLLVAHADTKVDMKQLTKYLGVGAGKLRFAPSDILWQNLKVKEGCVTPLALWNDRETHNVIVLIDSVLFDHADSNLLFHPLTNDFTTAIIPSELHTFLQSTGHTWSKIDLSNLQS